MTNENECKPEFIYPCLWVYKVIGRDLEQLRCAATEVLAGKEYKATSFRSSKGGAYHCLNVELTVESQPDRFCLYERLRQHPAVIMVM